MVDLDKFRTKMTEELMDILRHQSDYLDEVIQLVREELKSRQVHIEEIREAQPPALSIDSDDTNGFDSDKNSIVTTTPSLIGVKGWLLFFCLALTIFNPLLTVYSVVNRYTELKTISFHSQELITFCNIVTVCEMILMITGITVGILLWRVQPNGVKFAKLYLFLTGAYSIFLYFFLPSLVSDSSQFIGAMTKYLENTAGRPLVYAVVWYLYLIRSKRVQLTYFGYGYG